MPKPTAPGRRSTSCNWIWIAGLREYNQEREHSGKYSFGKRPLWTFLGAAHLAQEKMLDRLAVADEFDTAGQRFAPERSQQQRSEGARCLHAD